MDNSESNKGKAISPTTKLPSTNGESFRPTMTGSSKDTPSMELISVDTTKVTIQGFLQKKGYFNRYKKRYFYLEKHLLKWGDKEGKP